MVSYLFPNVLTPVRTAVGNFFAPMQKGITVVGSGISDKLKLFTDKQDLLDTFRNAGDTLIDFLFNGVFSLARDARS